MGPCNATYQVYGPYVFAHMPAAEVLEARIQDAFSADFDRRDSHDFIQETGIVKRLAGKKRNVYAAAATINVMMYQYYIENNKRTEGLPEAFFQTRMSMLFESIFRDCPQAIRELEELGYIKYDEQELICINKVY